MTVTPGDYVVFRVSDAGVIFDQEVATFSRSARARSSASKRPNGLLHWQETLGGLADWSFIRGESGPFLIREVYRGLGRLAAVRGPPTQRDLTEGQSLSPEPALPAGVEPTQIVRKTP